MARRRTPGGRVDYPLCCPVRRTVAAEGHTCPQRSTSRQGGDMAETWSGDFYCVKCKEKREASGEVRQNDKGTRMAKAVCPVCGTNLNRILGKA